MARRPKLHASQSWVLPCHASIANALLTLYFLLCPFPNLSYHLQELGTGRIVEGMHSSKRASYTATSDQATFDKLRSEHASDVIEFTEHSSLRLRKDMLPAVVYLPTRVHHIHPSRW